MGVIDWEIGDLQEFETLGDNVKGFKKGGGVQVKGRLNARKPGEIREQLRGILRRGHSKMEGAWEDKRKPENDRAGGGILFIWRKRKGEKTRQQVLRI